MAIIPVNRSIKDKVPIKEGVRLLKEDRVIGIFPEGTINRTNNTILAFKIGAIKMASDTTSIIIPFIIKGKYRVFGGKLSIEFLPPYKVESNDLDKENKKLMKKITNGLERSSL